MKKYFLLTVLLSVFLCSCQTEKASQIKEDNQATAIEATQHLLDRVIGNRSSDFVIEEIRSTSGLDLFEIESKNGQIIVRGNNSVAMASGINWYLKKYCNCQISMNYNQLKLPKKLPQLEEKIVVETPFEYRYLYNYCTYGYSMPWWNWEKWEETIDYMALMGVNMPLATIGQEAVWQDVYKELGMTDEQIDDFFVGPAHLPWGWMGNIDGLGGPLPKAWIEQRANLQKKILARMRSLGMKPVLQGFTGHVPKELKDLYPDAEIMKIHDWAGLPGTMFLDPTDPLFARIGTMFIEKQTEMFGTDHLYDADCFIEVDPPSSDTVFLSEVSKTVYESMKAADPDAIWVVQGWFFFFRSGFWQHDQGKAFVGGVPKDKIIVLDLYGEKNTTWDKTESFFGQPWIWNVICNEDQKVNMSGDLDQMQTNFQTAFQQEIGNNLKGIGTIPEGVGYNPIVQEYIFEKAWDQSIVDNNEWISDYAKRRYGTDNEQAVKAWQYLHESVYARTRTDWLPLITTPVMQIFETPKEDMRHVRKNIRLTEKNPFGVDYDIFKLHEASKALLNCADELQGTETYEFDVVNVHRELLAGLTYRVINDLSMAYNSGEIDQVEAAGKQLTELLKDLDKITGTNENFLLGKWIQEARSWGKTDAEKDYYEWNARTIVTIWMPFEDGGLRDYAGKQWNGLFSGYYLPRWELLIEQLKESLRNGTEFDQNAYVLDVRKIDFQWINSKDKYSATPTGNSLEMAKEIQLNYEHFFIE